MNENNPENNYLNRDCLNTAQGYSDDSLTTEKTCSNGANDHDDVTLDNNNSSSDY